MAHQPQPPNAGEHDQAADARPDPGLLPGNQPGPPPALPRRSPGTTDPAAFRYVTDPTEPADRRGVIAIVVRIVRILGARSELS
jgi:hypothetical protein